MGLDNGLIMYIKKKTEQFYLISRLPIGVIVGISEMSLNERAKVSEIKELILKKSPDVTYAFEFYDSC